MVDRWYPELAGAFNGAVEGLKGASPERGAPGTEGDIGGRAEWVQIGGGQHHTMALDSIGRIQLKILWYHKGD